eukprot:CAMPEP_0198112096 /NCGR_PEP_ID=MMETSP1442-20131203/3992_1 /TAXON_ID= /ORGANISM="Craspedostauros australis, Strain CCMP3328" /LENGTH=144 /DNA_ID=CAMNT_0043768765 /DNA_START=36 /DNA_END=470 /DNA_ORIENTATION=+
MPRLSLCAVAFIIAAMSSPAKSLATGGEASGSAAASPNDSNTDGQVPLLPASDPSLDIPTIKLGETIRFEEMGPIILNTDGSARRIANWDTLTQHEKDTTWRRISQRNEKRRLILLQQQQEAEAAAAAADAGDAKGEDTNGQDL